MTKNTEIELLKSTVNDIRSMLSDATSEGYVLDFDLDNMLVYIEIYDHVNHKYVTFKHSFTMTDTTVDIEEEGVQVIGVTEFKVVETSDLDKALTKRDLMSVLKGFFKGDPKSDPKDISVIKQFGDTGSEMFCIEPLYIAPGEVDGHGDTMDLEGITGMVDSLNKANGEGRLQSGLFHMHNTDSWSLEKSWVNPTACMIGDQLVPEGQPIAKTVFSNPVAFQMRVDGDISGLSIGARATGTEDLTKNLSEIQNRPEAVRKLLGVHFGWSHPELTYTSPSQGGAASLKNEAYEISKAKKAKIEDLDPEQASILKEIGEEFISLEKHLGTDKTQIPSSSSGEKVGEETKNIDKESNPMSDKPVSREEFEDLQKKLAVSEAVNSLSSFEFEADVQKALASAIANLPSDEDKEAVTKALDALVARSEEAVEKAKKAAPKEESDLTKSLDEELGEDGETVVVEKTKAERVLEAQANLKGDA